MSLIKKWFGGSGPKRVTLQPSGLEFEVGKSQTVLETALKKGLAYPHDCTVGTCGACRTRLVSGQVEAITPFGYTLSREELESGYILACQAIAKSDLLLDVELGDSGGVAPIRQAATLVSLEDLTHDIKRLVWRVDTPVPYRAGQYANVLWGAGDEHRSYSFATPPAANGSTELHTFVRHVPGGLFTDRLFLGEVAGLPFEIDGPHGNFWLRNGEGPMLCIAGGSGLAPILSVLLDAAHRRVRRDCILLFGARSVDDLYAADEIAEIRGRWTAGFEFWPVLSARSEPGFRSGLVTEHITPALERLGASAHAYLCGPPPMIDASIPMLTARGVALDDIHYDKFTDASTRGTAGGKG